ncbi:polymorphic toxin-type HINT domain-containing protein [Faucicola mancuniensis]|uniref:polymorphic toxin-type HINT domain-containing protein n=1 Tax=Faucicola mancuniensis TaxID=1309795 RepID=UPI0039772F89
MTTYLSRALTFARKLNSVEETGSTLAKEVNCSFRGDMEVRTINGYKSINEIQIGDMVWSKNEKTGLMGYQKVLHTMNSIDPDTTYVTITDSHGHSQQIVSDSLHPYFSSYGNDINPAKPSIGKEYHGDIKNAYWINAGDLKKGYKVLGSNGEWQVISEVYTVKTPLNSYNLEVNTDHTFFVKGIGGLDGVWVHNKNCFTAHGDNPTVEIIDGHQVTYSDYQIGLDLNKQPIMKRIPTITQDGKIIEVAIKDGKAEIVNANAPDVSYTQGNNRLVAKDPQTNTYVSSDHKIPERVRVIEETGEGRPTPQQSERDVGRLLPEGAREQVSYKDGKEVPYGTTDSVRPDWCIGTTCSIEVKNYDIHNNRSGLISNIAEQAIERVNHLPEGMIQEVRIDLRGQSYSDADLLYIRQQIEEKSNGIISKDKIKFIE